MKQEVQKSEVRSQKAEKKRFLIHFCLLLFAFCLLIFPVRAQERININTAPVEELMQLPGIGPTLAARIVEHRRKHGPFKRPQDIIIVHRMSAKLYRQLAPLLRT